MFLQANLNKKLNILFFVASVFFVFAPFIVRAADVSGSARVNVEPAKGEAVVGVDPASSASPVPTSASPCKDGLCRPANYNQEWAGSMLRGTVPGIINGVLTRVLPLVGVVFLVMFVWGGIQWLTSAGDAKKVSHAKTTLFNAIVGVTIVSLAYFIVSQFLRLISI